MVSGIVNLISLWYFLMYRDLYDIWFLWSWWLTRDVRGDFVALIVRSWEPSSEWVKLYPWLVSILFNQSLFLAIYIISMESTLTGNFLIQAYVMVYTNTLFKLFWASLCTIFMIWKNYKTQYGAYNKLEGNVE